VDHMIAQARYGGAIGPKLRYRLYGKGFLRGPEYHADHNDFDSWHQERGGMRLDWRQSDDSEYMVEADLYGGTSPAETGPTSYLERTAGGDLVARWRRKFNNGSDIYLQTYFDRTTRGALLFAETRNTFDVDFMHRFRIAEQHQISYGFGLHWSPNRFVPHSASFNVLPNVTTDYIHTGFLQDEIHLLHDRLLVTAGAKIEGNNYTGVDIQPTGRLLWNANPHQSFWGGVTRAVTTPSRIEEGFSLYGGQISTNPPVGLYVVGNPDFQSERVLGYEGGYRQLLSEKVFVSLSVFHNQYDQLQSFSAPTLVGSNLNIFYENAIRGTTNGIEIAPNWKPKPWWALSGSYSYAGLNFHTPTPGSDISSTGSVRTYEGSSPHHQIKIQNTIDLGKRFEFDQSYYYVSALPAQSVRAYQTMDARFGWRLQKDLEFSVVGQNLFQPYHAEWGTGDPSESPIGIRRAVYFRLSWQSSR
jgi:iron complex outermembrane recepter protein